MQDRDTLSPKAKKVKQVAWLIGTIQDLARDIEIETWNKRVVAK